MDDESVRKHTSHDIKEGVGALPLPEGETPEQLRRKQRRQREWTRVAATRYESTEEFLGRAGLNPVVSLLPRCDAIACQSASQSHVLRGLAPPQGFRVV